MITRITYNIFSIFVTAAFFAWLLPLGAFINSSQERTACGGSRAFHMCTMGMSAAQDDSRPRKISYSDASAAEKTNKSSGGSSGNEFMPSESKLINKIRAGFTKQSGDLLYAQYFQEIPNPPPNIYLRLA